MIRIVLILITHFARNINYCQPLHTMIRKWVSNFFYFSIFVFIFWNLFEMTKLIKAESELKGHCVRANGRCCVFSHRERCYLVLLFGSYSLRALDIKSTAVGKRRNFSVFYSSLPPFSHPVVLNLSSQEGNSWIQKLETIFYHFWITLIGIYSFRTAKHFHECSI